MLITGYILDKMRKHWWIILYLLIYFLVINLVVLNRFWQYEALYFDHGIFDSSLWQVAHFHAPLIDHLGTAFMTQIGDHFDPTIYLLSPLYWFTSAYEPLLIIENLFVVLSAFVLYLIARDKIKNLLMVFAIIFAYTFFVGLQNAIIANFHAELITLFTLSLTLYTMEKKRWVWFFVFLFLTLGTKQNFATIGAGLGIYLFFKNKKLGIVTVLLSLFYYFVVTRFVIPHYAYEQIAWGNLFLPKIKTETMFVSLATFGFLPFGALTFFPAIFQDFFSRFVLNPGAARWDLGLHYNATLSVLLAFGTILTASKLNRKLTIIFAVLIIVITLFFHRFRYHGPLGLVYNPAFYKHTGEMVFIKNFLAKVPAGKTVMTHNNLAPYLTHTNNVMLLRGNYEDFHPDLIVLDIRPGQNPVNFWPMNEKSVDEMAAILQTDPNYQLTYKQGDQMIFSKRSSLP